MRPTYQKPYPEYIDRENPFPRGYKRPDFTLFSGEDDYSTVEHICRFTVQCGKLATHDNYKLRLFGNSLTGWAFGWFSSLSPNSILTWQDMERLFHGQFYRTQPEVCIADLSRIAQRAGEPAEGFIARFKRMRKRCKTYLPESEFVKMAQRGLDIELRKKFQGMEFRDFFELAAKVADYEELLREEVSRRSQTTYP